MRKREDIIIENFLDNNFHWILLINSGDRVVALGGQEMQTYFSPQNFQLNISYPQAGGLGANITFAQIDVLQVKLYRIINNQNINH